MIVEPFGELHYHQKDKEWFGCVDNICPDSKVELSICVDNERQDLSLKIDLVKGLARDYDAVKEKLHELTYIKYKNTEWEKSLDEIKRMYFLAGVSLKEDNRTWWLVLEPVFDVTSIYNHFLRFTMVERKIVWANFDIHTAT